MKKVIIQGFPGSFHDDVAHRYFHNEDIEPVCASSFHVLGQRFQAEHDINYAVMAIENSIAGTILQNYKIIREQQFSIIGEAYLRIKMNLMASSDVEMSDIKEVHSHPMALYQCTQFLKMFPHIKLVESEDTALSAKFIADFQKKDIAAIASKRASKLYGLPIIAEGIEDNKANYTRFFVLSRHPQEVKAADKASIWIRIGHEAGSLLQVLSIIANQGVNLSKLQSYPVLGRFSEYAFHMDLEFEDIATYYKLKEILQGETKAYQELGIYKRADISAALRKEEVSVML